MATITVEGGQLKIVNGDYIEMHVKNTSNTNDVVVTDLNVLITEID